MVTVNACTSTVPPVPYIHVSIPIILSTISTVLHGFKLWWSASISYLFVSGNTSVCNGCKGRYVKDAQPPHNLCIQHEDWRISPQVDLQHPIHVLAMYITIAVLPTFLLYALCHHKFSFLHIHVQLDFVHKKWIYS